MSQSKLSVSCRGAVCIFKHGQGDYEDYAELTDYVLILPKKMDIHQLYKAWEKTWKPKKKNKDGSPCKIKIMVPVIDFRKWLCANYVCKEVPFIEIVDEETEDMSWSDEEDSSVAVDVYVKDTVL